MSASQMRGTFAMNADLCTPKAMSTQESNKLIADSCGIKVVEDGLTEFTHWSIVNPEPEPMKQLIIGIIKAFIIIFLALLLFMP